DAVLAALGGETQVAAHRDAHRPAHAEAVDHRDRRLRALADRRVGGRGGLAVALRRLGVLALLLELGDVRARGESHGPGAAVDDATHRLVLHEPLGDARDLHPPGVPDRVAGLGPVEDDGGDATVAPDEDVVAVHD